MSHTILHARWIVPVTSAPIENGLIVVESGQIVSVEKVGIPDPSVVDLGDAVVIPGLVNAHAHLELTACHDRVPYRGSFTGWIEQLTAVNPHTQPGDALEQSIRDGLQQSLAAGTTTVADIGAGPCVFSQWKQASINILGFLEVLGIGPMLVQNHMRSTANTFEVCQNHLKTNPNDTSLRIGISPHAPFSTDPSLYRDAVAFAQNNRLPICTHLAETQEESQFLSDATGPFRELLEKFNLWDGSFQPPRCSPIQYARQLGLLECQPLLVHVNYLSDQDLDLIAEKPCSIAYCPRSHHFFKHQSHRYRDMIALGINVCIGTDSLASNESLSILDELRFLRTRDQDITNQQLIEMATIAGARALKLGNRLGSLETGKRADLTVIPLTNLNTADPMNDLLTGNKAPSASYVTGRQVHPLTDINRNC